MFDATVPFALFDYFRVPYVVERASGRATATVRPSGGAGAALSWPTDAQLGREGRDPQACLLGSGWVVGRVAPEAQMARWARRRGGSWRPLHLLRNRKGTHVSSIWRRDDGSTLLPFDPNAVVRMLWSEAYHAYVRGGLSMRAAALARRGYYRARPILPRRVQMDFRRSFSRVQAKAPFPRWPIETSLHDLYALLFGFVAEIADGAVPFIGPWPSGKRWAFVLTHDVEGSVGYRNVDALRHVETVKGYRSAWNFVPQGGYVVDDRLVEGLRRDGFEVGVHGLFHDGRDVASRRMVRRRLPAIRTHAERWGADGFRSPATLRSAELMPLLGFDYDSSFSDTAPFEPQPGGCCSWLPYNLGKLVELPITMPQDHTLFELLGERDARHWLAKAAFLRERGGMALMLTHPDYVTNPALVDAYANVLDEFAGDDTAWKALPRDVSSWWRRRAASQLMNVGGQWVVTGPARDEAQVEFALAEEVLAA